MNFWVGYTEPFSIVNYKCKKSIERFGIVCYNIPSVHGEGNTPFNRTRFLVPLLDTGEDKWVGVCDDDFIFLNNPNSIVLGDKTLYVCQHEYKTKHAHKLNGKSNINYPRKNWASLMIINKEKFQLKIEDIMNNSLQYLLQFEWIEESEIGKIPLEWNWLVNEYIYKSKVNAVHYTIGGPWCDNHIVSEYDKIWENLI